MDIPPQDPSSAGHEFAALPSVPAPSPWYHWRRLGFNFLTISVLAHLFFGFGATYFIVQTIQAKRKQTFAGPPQSPNAPTRALEHKVQMQKKQQTMSAPAPVKRITTTAVNTKVALPAMPAMPPTDGAVKPLSMAGMGGTGVGLGMGGRGTGTGTGGGGGGITLFGLRQKSDSALVGTFYDFKQGPDGKPTSMTVKDEHTLSAPEAAPNDEAKAIVGRYGTNGFSESVMSKFFKGPAPLYTTQIFIPTIPADDGPKEFNLADKVRPRRWVVVYRGKVTPPESGRYHFVGVADDYLIVRFRNQLVLDGSIHRPTEKKAVKEYFFEGLGGALRCNQGEPFNVNAGEHYDIEILLGEQPGGEFLAFLLLEKEGAKYDRDAKGNPILPIFKMAPSNTPRTGRDAPVTSADTSWSVWKAEKP